MKFWPFFGNLFFDPDFDPELNPNWRIRGQQFDGGRNLVTQSDHTIRDQHQVQLRHLKEIFDIFQLAVLF